MIFLKKETVNMSINFRLLVLFFLTVLYVQDLSAQRWKRMRREACLGLTTTNFLGELGGKNAIGTNDIKDFDVQATRPGFTFGYYYRLSNMSAYQIRTNMVMLSGDDKRTLEPFRNNRNLHFRSPLVEVNGQLDIYLLTKRRGGHRYSIGGVRGRSLMDYQVYGFVGVGVFWFSPYAKDTREDGDGKWHRLRPLRTEGQGLVASRKKYWTVQPNIPLGIGARLALNRFWMVGIEYGYRHTWTDYIDDVSSTYLDPEAIRQAAGEKGDLAVYLANPSLTRDIPNDGTQEPGTMTSNNTAPGQQRGDPRDKDAYMFASITVFYKLPKRGFSIPKF